MNKILELLLTNKKLQDLKNEELFNLFIDNSLPVGLYEVVKNELIRRLTT